MALMVQEEFSTRLNSERSFLRQSISLQLRLTNGCVVCLHLFRLWLLDLLLMFEEFGHLSLALLNGHLWVAVFLS